MVLAAYLEEDPAVRLFQYIKHAVMDKLKKVIEKKRVDPNARLAVEVDTREPPALCAAVFPEHYSIPVAELYEKPVSQRLRSQVLEYLIRKGSRTDVADRRGHTPIHLAILKEDYELLERLLKITRGVDTFDEAGHSPLILCFECKEATKFAERILKHGADINACGSQGTALHYVVSKNKKEFAEFLVRKGCNVDIPAGLGRRPLHIAVSNKNLGVTDLLLSNGAEVNSLDNLQRSALHYACLKGATQLVGYLLQNGARAGARDREGNLPIHYAALHADAKAMELLIGAGADINAIGHRNRTALHCAAMRGDDSVILFLSRSGADARLLDQDGWSPLSIAVRRKHEGVVELLLQREPALVEVCDQPTGESVLHIAGAMQHEGLVRMLVSRGSNINATSADGRTPLHALLAVQGELLPHIYAFLVQKGAHVNAIDNQGLTSVHYAVRRGDPVLVSFLESQGGDVNARDGNGKTPLHYARHVPVASALLQLNADLEARDNSGKRPLHDAAAAGSLDVVRFLVESGALVNVEDDSWQTPRTVAPAGPVQDFLKAFDMQAVGDGVEGRTPTTLTRGASVASASAIVSPDAKPAKSLSVLQQPRMVPLVAALLDDFKGLLNDQEFSDVTLLVENRPIYAHKAILVARCHYFRRMFGMERKGEARTQEFRIRVTGFRYVVFVAMLEFLYGCSVEINDDIALELYLIAGKFGLEVLRDLAYDHIRRIMSVDNAVQLLLLAVQNKAEPVKKLAVTFIAQHYHSIPDLHALTAQPDGAALLLEIMDHAQGRAKRAPFASTSSGASSPAVGLSRPQSVASPFASGVSGSALAAAAALPSTPNSASGAGASPRVASTPPVALGSAAREARPTSLRASEPLPTPPPLPPSTSNATASSAAEASVDEPGDAVEAESA